MLRRQLPIESPSPLYMCRLQLVGRLALPKCQQPRSQTPAPRQLLAWGHHMVPLGQLPVARPQAFRNRSRSRVVKTGHRHGCRCHPGVRWWCLKPKEYPTTWLVFWRVLWMSGTIRESFGRTKLRPCNWCPRGKSPTVLVFAQRPILPDHKCRNSVRLLRASGCSNSLAWEPSKHRTDWQCLESRIHSHLFGERSAWPDRDAGGSVPQWRSLSVSRTPSRLPYSIPIWPSLWISSH